MKLRTGLIDQQSYNQNLGSNEFLELEKYNDDFLIRNKKELAEYHGKWTNDSFHTWSRQYEYPFFYESVASLINKNPEKKLKILDAGSGLTFFPYFLAEKFPNVEIVCTDYDPILRVGFENINKNQVGKVHFIQSDLRQKVFDKESFDLIYCVSVLEHTSEFKQIIQNFNSYLKEGGSFALSFDVSLDSYRDIPVEKALILVENLNSCFAPIVPENLVSHSQINKKNLLTTLVAIKSDKRLSPWRNPYKNFLWCLKKFKIPRFYFETALYCQLYKKN